VSLDFGDVLESAVLAYGPLCVGIDPHAFLLADWGLPDSAAGAREFGLRVVDAAAESAGIVKPQVAFFERHGSAGYAALEAVLAAARSAGLIVIADVKRGDVGTSVGAYGEAWLTPGSPLEADAMTISAFQGVGSIADVLQLAADSGKGAFVLAATSNPEAAAIQQAKLADGRTVARAIIDEVSAFNATVDGATIGPIGVVLGATLDLADFGIDTGQVFFPKVPVLAPGFGRQGARLADAAAIYGSLARFAIVSESRSILAAGPQGIGAAVAERAAEIRAALG
jgi:orotidine-5'-phosphate decarboxylase